MWSSPLSPYGHQYVRLLCLWTFLSAMSGLALPIKMVWSGKRQADAIALAIIATGFVGLVLMVGHG